MLCQQSKSQTFIPNFLLHRSVRWSIFLLNGSKHEKFYCEINLFRVQGTATKFSAHLLRRYHYRFCGVRQTPAIKVQPGVLAGFRTIRSTNVAIYTFRFSDKVPYSPHAVKSLTWTLRSSVLSRWCTCKKTEAWHECHKKSVKIETRCIWRSLRRRKRRESKRPS